LRKGSAVKLVWISLWFVSFLFLSHVARAEPPPWVRRAVVTVDAYEHTSRGIAIDRGRRILVPFRAVEVDRPGKLRVTDIEGRELDARVVGTDRASSLAVLEVEAPITITLAYRPEPPVGPGFYGLSHGEWKAYSLTEPFDEGSPIVNEDGVLVSMLGVRSTMDGTRDAVDLDKGLPRVLAPNASRVRRPWIFYGGASMQVDTARDGGVWWGGGFTLGVRYRDLIEARVDHEITYLFPKASAHECSEPPCFAGMRGVLTPSIGPRIVIPSPLPISAPLAITPSLGYAFGVQYASPGESPAFDAKAKNAWAHFAPGVTFSWGPGEFRFRIRRDGDSPTVEMAIGFLL